MRVSRDIDETYRYSQLLIDLQQCTELINGDADRIREFSVTQKNAVIKVLDVLEETMQNVGNVDKFIDKFIRLPKGGDVRW